MPTEVLDKTSSLPYWMQFVILILFSVSALVMMIIRYRQESNRTKSEGLIRDSLIKNEDKLSTLLDLLFDKYANNVSIDVAKSIITMVNIKSKYYIRDKVMDILANKEITTNMLHDLEEFIINKYYEDSMFLNRITCKGIKLNFNHTDSKPSIITEQVLNYINGCCLYGTCNPINQPCKDVDIFLSLIFTTSINKTLMAFEQKLNTHDYGIN